MKIDKIYAPSAEDLTDLRTEFWTYACSRIPDLRPESEDQEFLFSARDGERLIGGIYGSVYWNGLEIDTLWVDANHRGSGIGSRLLAEAEKFARDKAAVIAFFKTVEARDFYEKRGYRVYGVLEDRPVGTMLYHMKKRLDD
jgi:GNAT superfamily N-acetyltransferase